jgi:hypothetical protein
MQIKDTPKDKEAQETSKSEEYYDLPCKLDCPICLKEVVTYMNEEYSGYAWIFTIGILVFYGILIGLPLLILALSICKNKTHCCSICLNQLYVKKFSPISIKGAYIEFKFEKCVVILRKIYVYFILFVFLLVAVILNAYSLVFYENNLEIVSSEVNSKSLIDTFVSKIQINENNIQWEDLINNCGSKVIVNNGARAQEIFERKFQGKVVNWKGHFIGAVINYSSPFDYNPKHVVNYYIRMFPSESLNGADIILSLSHKQYLIYKDLHLNKGESMSFTASLESLGNEWQPHHLHGITISKIPEFVDYDQKVTLFKGVNLDIQGKRVHTSNKEITEIVNKNNQDPLYQEKHKEHKEKENEVINNLESSGKENDKDKKTEIIENKIDEKSESNHHNHN